MKRTISGAGAPRSLPERRLSMRRKSLVGAFALAMSIVAVEAGAVVPRVSLVEEFGFFS
jgi:hypothetical protein